VFCFGSTGGFKAMMLRARMSLQVRSLEFASSETGHSASRRNARPSLPGCVPLTGSGSAGGEARE
jgi:hypothetical protein